MGLSPPGSVSVPASFTFAASFSIGDVLGAIRERRLRRLGTVASVSFSVFVSVSGNLRPPCSN